MLAEVQQISGSSNHLVAKACANALTHGHAVKTGKNGQISSWAKNVYEARSALDMVRSGDYQQIEKAEYFIHKALVENPDTPLAAVVHLRLMESKGSMPKLAVRSLAQIYHERWPDCLQFTLTLSNELMESGESNPGSRSAPPGCIKRYQPDKYQTDVGKSSPILINVAFHLRSPKYWTKQPTKYPNSCCSGIQPGLESDFCRSFRRDQKSSTDII